MLVWFIWVMDGKLNLFCNFFCPFVFDIFNLKHAKLPWLVISSNLVIPINMPTVLVLPTDVLHTDWSYPLMCCTLIGLTHWCVAHWLADRWFVPHTDWLIPYCRRTSHLWILTLFWPASGRRTERMGETNNVQWWCWLYIWWTSV